MKIVKTSLFFFIFIFSNLFSYQVIEDTSSLQILSESLKNRKTKKIILPNKLKILFISDPDIDESGASMAVGVGHWHDSKEYPGIAHFTEHMLFQGTSEFPEHNSFSKYLNDVLGMANAYTSFDKTVYMFTCPNSHFQETLKRFSYFFKTPLVCKRSYTI